MNSYGFIELHCMDFFFTDNQASTLTVVLTGISCTNGKLFPALQLLLNRSLR